MSDDKTKPITTREFLNERDIRIFKMRQAGTSVQEIARRFGVSTSSVTRSVQRQLEKMNKEAILAYPEVLRLELERLDNLQQAIWPMTQHRREVQEDGTEIQIEPDLKAVQQVLSVMDRRAKLLGMDRMSVNVSLGDSSSVAGQVKVALAGSEKTASEIDLHSPEQDAKRLIALMIKAGILPMEELTAIALSSGVIIDAEEVVDTTIGGDGTSDE